MPDHSATFVWCELMTTDVEAAKRFYQAVVGWEMEAFDPSGEYTVIKADGRGIGGMMHVRPEAAANGARPAWLGYIAVDDVEEARAKIERAGGKSHMDGMDIPGVGRIAVVADPQGAAFYLIAPEGDDQQPVPEMSLGHVAWHELHTTDWAAAFDFYSHQFGWAKGEAMDMGPMGTYQIFTTDGPNWKGAMFNADTFGRPAWLFYFVVGDIDEAAERVRSVGGEVLEGPMEVPGSAWIIQCRDPQGAMFALVGRRS